MSELANGLMFMVPVSDMVQKAEGTYFQFVDMESVSALGAIQYKVIRIG